jgi:DNA-binding beta-propeller fold protein YncE
MLNKNITKKILFVTIIWAICAFFINCRFISSNNSASSGESEENLVTDYAQPKVVGTIKSNEITESSGLVQSRCIPNVFWTHNDSGGSEFIYAINEKGERLGTWKVSGAKNNDWEDMATLKDKAGKCFLYLGDIGNNGGSKNQFTIYKVAEPKVTEADKKSSKKKPSKTETAEAIKFSYQNANPDAETLLVHPATGEIYVLTKPMLGASEVFKVGAKTEKVGSVSVPALPNGFLTGGEISPDGRRVIVCDYYAGYEILLPKNAKKFDEIWGQSVTRVDLGEREQGEAICYSADGKKVYATSEKKNSPVIRVERK